MVDQKINLNTATAEELAQLPGIGPVLAQRLISYRDTVHRFEEPAEITAVSGIGERSYRAIADRLTVASPAASSPLPSEMALPEEEEEDVTQEISTDLEEAGIEGAEAPLEEGAAEEMTEIEAVPPGESFAQQPMQMEEEPEEGLDETAPVAEGVSPEAPEEPAGDMEAMSAEDEAVPEAPDETLPAESLEEEAAEGPPAEPEPAEEELAEGPPAEPEPAEEELAEGPSVEPEPAEEELAEEELPPASFATAAEPTPSPPWWRRLSWLWTAVLGGLLGMIFALIVWAGINGSLDVGHSPAVVGIQGQLNGLATDVETLGTDVEGLQRRLEVLEGLTSRMEEVESSVDELREETSALGAQADALEQELEGVSEELQIISENVETLQDQAERAQSFFSGLQLLLMDVFGDVEGVSAPTPTPTPEGK